MEQEHIEAMKEGREIKEASRVRIELPAGWLLSSYEYGWTIEKDGKQFFYTDCVTAIYSASAKEVSTSGAKSILAIGAKTQSLYSELQEAADRLGKLVEAS